MNITHFDPLRDFYQFVETHPDLSQRQIAEHFHIGQATVSRRLKARANVPIQGETPSEPPGEPGEPTTALQSPVVVGELVGELVGSPRLDTLESRVDVLEAFIKTLQQQPTYLPGSPNGLPAVHPALPGGLPSSPSGSPTHKRGFVLADDLFDAIHTYAQAHHLQVKDVVDVALRTFFAQVGQEVGDA
jgi:hypothetical protein